MQGIRGREIRYVTGTPFGSFVLPAQLLDHEDETKSRVKVFTDDTGGSEWITSVPYSADKLPGTWHEVND